MMYALSLFNTFDQSVASGGMVSFAGRKGHKVVIHKSS
ncbi:unnamed protein product [Musa hybrid cultivar]